MKALISILLLLSLMISCKDDSPTEPDDKKDVLATATIGNEGGELTDENVKLIIPPDAIVESATIELYEISLAPHVNPVTSAYGIDGIPIGNSKAIEIEFTLTDAPPENTNIVLMHEEFVKSTGTVREVSQILETVYEAGVLRAAIPASVNTGLVKSNGITEEGKYTITIFGQVTGFKQISSDNHFELHVPASMAGNATIMAGYFEDAYRKVKALGFNFSGRTNWPVKVYVKKLNDDGGFVSGKWSANSGFIELNESLFSKNEEEFKATIGHEFFHLIQDLYDTRGAAKKFADNARNKATGYLPNSVWLDEAASTWFEEKFSSNANYVSPNVGTNMFQPYLGPEYGFTVDAANHGYGMASLIKYLVKKHGEDLLVKIYNKLKTGSLPLDAIQFPIETPLVLWWSTYLKDYTSNSVYPDVHSANYIKNAYENTTTYKIDDLTNATKGFNDSFPDLSTRFYYIDLNYTVADQNAVINCSHGTSHLTLFSVDGFDLIYQGFSSDGSFEISNLNAFRESNDDLLIMVTDYMGNSPYDKSHSIPLDLTITTQEKPEFDLSIYDEMYLAINCKATRTNVAGDSFVNYEYPDNWGILKVSDFIGSFTGNTFNVDFTSYSGTDNAEIEEATASATIDMDNMVVKNISINLKYSHANDEFNTFEQNIRISELPFIEKYNYLKFGLYGETGGSVISNFKDFEQDGDLFLEYKDLQFNSNSYVVLFFNQK